MPNSLYKLPYALLNQNLSVGLFLLYNQLYLYLIENTLQVLQQIVE